MARPKQIRQIDTNPTLELMQDEQPLADRSEPLPAGQVEHALTIGQEIRASGAGSRMCASIFSLKFLFLQNSRRSFVILAFDSFSKIDAINESVHMIHRRIGARTHRSLQFY